MATQVQFRRGTTTQNNAFTGAIGELTVDTDVLTLRLHDGTTQGGGAYMVTTQATQTLLNKTLSTGSNWEGNIVDLAYGGTGSSLTAVAGAIGYSTSSGLGFSAVGSSGQVLTSGGANPPAWVNASSLTVGTSTVATLANNLAGGSAGYLPYQAAADTTSYIAPGATGTFLRSTGASTPPNWASADVTIGTTAVDLGGSAVDFAGVNSFAISGTDASTSNTTGALTVAGGVGISGAVNIGGNTDVDGTLTVTGNTTLTTATVNGVTTVGGSIIPSTNITYDLGSTTKRFRDIYLAGTTIDLGGMELSYNSGLGELHFSAGGHTMVMDMAAADDLVMVAASQTLSNKTLASPVVTTRISTTSTTVGLLDTTATTINFGGAATTIDIGATTGTLNINNKQTVFNSTDSIKIPVGTTAQRDSTPVAGQIRYNSTISSFEGYGPGNAWGSLGGVKDVDQDTYLLTEASAGSDEDTFQFYNVDVNTLSLSGTAFDLKSQVTMTVNNTTDASSSTTGAVIIDGGVGIAKQLYVGTNANVLGRLGVNGITTLTGVLNANAGIAVDTSAFTVANTTGNTAIAGTLNVTGATVLNGGLTMDTNKFTVANTTGNTAIGGTLGVTGATTLSNTLDVTGVVNLNNTTDSTSKTTGALIVDGGVGIAKNLHVGTNLEVDGNIIIDGNFTVNGTTTTINATELAIEDNLIYLNEGSSITNPDLGWVGNYNNGTYGHAGIFRDASDGGTFKIFDSYTPEPGSAIDTSHASFDLADLDVGGFSAADNATIGGTLSVTGTINRAPTITLGGDLSGAVTLTDLQNGTLTATINANSVALGTDTTGNYVATIAGTTNRISVSGSGSETAAVTLSLPQDIHTGASPTFAGLNIGTDSLSEYISDTIGAMVTGNTESGISVTYDDADNTLDFNVNDPVITLTGVVTGSATMTNLGNVSIATTATSDPTLTINGDASGSATFTNLGNATLTLTIADDSHNHIVSNIDGIQEYIEDTVGAMVASNTESGIAVTYDDTNGKLNFDVNDPTITLTGDVTGSATMTNLGNVSISTTVAANSVDLGTDTTGNYVATVAAGGGISVSGSGSETAAVTVSHADTSTQGSINNSGNTFIQDITLDTYGHITGISSATAIIGDGTITINPGRGLDSGGSFTTNQTGSATITLDLETDLRDSITHIGTDTNDYIQWSNNTWTRMVINGAEQMRADSSGTIHARTEVIGYSTTLSDPRLKTNIKKVENALDKVMLLNGYEFEYKHDGKKSAGVLAPEMEAVMPSAVMEKELPLVDASGEKYKIVQYDQIHALLIEAIKEQQIQIEELKAKVAELGK